MIGVGVHIHLYVYMFVDQKKNLNRTLAIFKRSRTSRRIYRLALPLEKLSSLSKSRIFIFNAHLTLFDRSTIPSVSIVI